MPELLSEISEGLLPASSEVEAARKVIAEFVVAASRLLTAATHDEVDTASYAFRECSVRAVSAKHFLIEHARKAAYSITADVQAFTAPAPPRQSSWERLTRARK